MNNTILAGIIVGGVVVAAASAIAVNSGYNPLQKYATVVSVAQAYDTTETPRVVCGDETTLAQAQAAAAAQTQGDAGTGQQASAPQAVRNAARGAGRHEGRQGCGPAMPDSLRHLVGRGGIRRHL